ncbi:MAG: RNA polymerase sigma factor [Cyclobacteriaceae bacterium]|nr:RNA polymerase sigma factor [Cyclobacteriaceae bacterium]
MVDIFENKDLNPILNGCLKNDRKSQKLLYKHFFGYAMSICIRYTENRADALEVLNDSFMKVFTNLKNFNQERSFKSWFRRILINTSIDHLKKEMKHQYLERIEEHEIGHHHSFADQNIGHEELISLVQGLSPAYRSVFNLYVIDGYNHQEIAEILGISEGTSKSNLSKARMNLREMLKKIERNEFIRIAR